MGYLNIKTLSSVGDTVIYTDICIIIYRYLLRDGCDLPTAEVEMDIKSLIW